MKLAKRSALACALCAGALAMGLLAGCTTSTTDSGSAEESAQELNRAYMSQVNEIMDDLDEQLEAFVDAVSRDDLVTMRTQAEAAFDTLDALDELEVPDGLETIHENYVDGADSLEEALNAYIDLYAEVSADDAQESFDWDTYDERLAEVQELYDAGISALQAADEAAAAME